MHIQGSNCLLITYKERIGAAHSHSKYLGVFIFTSPNPEVPFELFQAEVISFFIILSHIYLSVHEVVTILKLLLISTLNCRLVSSQLTSLQHRIWTCIVHKAKLLLTTLLKDKHSTINREGLNL